MYYYTKHAALCRHHLMYANRKNYVFILTVFLYTYCTQHLLLLENCYKTGKKPANLCLHLKKITDPSLSEDVTCIQLQLVFLKYESIK